MNWKIGIFCVCSMAVLGMSKPAQAQDYSLHFAQAGALLDYSNVELRILYAAVTAREYDPKVTKDTVAELKRSLGDAKRHAGRTATLLPEKLAKHEAAVEKLRSAISAAEDQLSKLATDIDEQTKSLFAEDEEVELGERSADDEGEGGGEAAPVNWDLLKSGTGWLGVDIGVAKKQHRKLSSRLKIRSLKAAPKPRGKRPE